MCNLHNMCDYTHLGVTQRCVVYTMCVIFTEYVVFAPIHCYAAFTLSVCSFTHFVLFCVFFSFLHKPSDFLHWLCLAQQIYAILSWNSFVVIYAFFGVNFLIQKFCPCKKNDKYEVWVSCENRVWNGQVWKIISPPIFNENEPNFDGWCINTQKIEKKVICLSNSVRKIW